MFKDSSPYSSLQQSNLCMFLADSTRRPIAVSLGLARLLGYSATEEVPLGDLWRLHLHSSDSEGSGGPMPYRLIDLAGRERWVREVSSPLEGAGEAPLTQSVLLEVTDTVETEQRLLSKTRELRERVKELNCFYAITHLSTDGSISELLESVVRILPEAWQYPERARCSILYDGIRYDSGSGPFEGPSQTAELIIGGRVAGCVEVGYRHAEGGAEAQFLPEEWALLTGIARRLSDVLERRETAEALRSSEALYRTLAKNLPQTLVGLFDEKLRCTVAEGALKGALSKVRVEGRGLDEVWTKDLALLREMCRSALAGEARTAEHWWKDLALSIRVVPVSGRTGAPGGMFVIMDVTGRRRLEQEVLAVSAREQRRVGQDLHDSLGQILTGLMCLSGTLHRNLENESSRHAALAEDITQVARQAMTEMREVARGLNPLESRPPGLGAMLQSLAYDCENLFHVSCQAQLEQGVEVADPEAEIQLYRIVQEAISNAVRHGKASAIVLRLAREEGRGLLRIQDNGSGFAPAASGEQGMGMRIMTYRAEMIGGSLNVVSKRGRGTEIICRFPMASATGAGADA